MHSILADVEIDPVQLAPSTPHLTMLKQMGDGRRLRGSVKGKGGRRKGSKRLTGGRGVARLRLIDLGVGASM